MVDESGLRYEDRVTREYLMKFEKQEPSSLLWKGSIIASCVNAQSSAKLELCPQRAVKTRRLCGQCPAFEKYFVS